MKPLASRNKEELIDLHDRLNLTLPEADRNGRVTRKDLLLSLQQQGVDNRKIKLLETKEKTEAVPTNNLVSPNGMSVVCMDRPNASFAFKRYKFTQEKKYVVMPLSDADELISQNTGFRKASGEEVRRYYNERNILK